MLTQPVLNEADGVPLLIHDAARLRELLEEAAEWPLAKRREYIESMRKAFGPEAAQQIKDGLTEMWRRRNGNDAS